MKKLFTFILSAAILLPLLFTACQKEQEEEQEQLQEGVYNPQEKIDRVVSDWRMITQTFSEETNSWETANEVEGIETYSEIWQWNGNVLESIIYYKNGGEYGRAYFTYQNNRIHSIIQTNDIVEWQNYTIYYSYDGDKLSRVQSFQGSTLVEEYQMIHTGDKITRIIISENYPDSKNCNNTFSLCPSGTHSSWARIMASIKSKHNRKGEPYQGVLDLEWTGDNISRASWVEDGGEHWICEFTYDNKINPYYGMLFRYGYDGYSGILTSRNNILSEKCIYSELEGVAWCDEYSYTYNGEWPDGVHSLVSASSYYDNSERMMNETVSHFIYK